MIEPYGPLVLLCTSVHLPSNGHFLQDKKEKNENDVDEDLVPYSFFLDDREITKSLEETLNADGERSVEKITEIIYQPQAQFKLVSVSYLVRSGQRELLNPTFLISESAP